MLSEHGQGVKAEWNFFIISDRNSLCRGIGEIVQKETVCASQ
jgi:hypothetical protein